MKRLLSLLVFVLAAIPLFAVEDLVEECENIPDVSTVSINQKMLKLASFPDKGSNPIDLEAIAGRLDKIQIINADEPAAALSVKNVVGRYLKGTPRFERTMKMKDGDESTMMYVRTLSNNRGVPKNEFIIIVEDIPDITVILLIGDISMDELANVTDL